jgi:hypothetical protein
MQKGSNLDICEDYNSTIYALTSDFFQVFMAIFNFSEYFQSYILLSAYFFFLSQDWLLRCLMAGVLQKFITAKTRLSIKAGCLHLFLFSWNSYAEN